MKNSSRKRKNDGDDDEYLGWMNPDPETFQSNSLSMRKEEEEEKGIAHPPPLKQT